MLAKFNGSERWSTNARNFLLQLGRVQQILREGQFAAVHHHEHLFSGALLRCAQGNPKRPKPKHYDRTRIVTSQTGIQ
jgi:hypothetical protein